MTDLPPTWCATTVAVISDPLRYGYTASANPEADGPKMLRITDIQNGQVQWLGVPRCEISPDKRDQFLVSTGDIVFARTGGTVGKSFLIREVPEPAVFASYLIKVSPATGVEPRYLYWFFQSLNYWEQIAQKKGGLQGNVNAKTLGSIELAFAPTNEQRRIVERIEMLFDEIDRGRRSLRDAKGAIGLYRESLLKSAFEGRLTADWRAKNPDKLECPHTLLGRIRGQRQDCYKAALRDWERALGNWREEGGMGKKPAKPKQPRAIPAKPIDNGIPGWTTVPLGLVVVDPIYGTPKKCGYGTGATGVLRIPNIGSGRVDPTDLKSADFDETESARFSLQEGDILTVRSNGSLSIVGKPAMVRQQHTDYLFAGYLIRLRPIVQSLVPKYLVYMLMEPTVRAQIETKAKSTSGVNNISAKELQELNAPICCPEEQAEIVRILDASLEAAEIVDADIDVNLARADALRQSILKKAFSGELVSQDPDDEPAQALLARIRASRSEDSTTRPRRRARRRASATAPS